MRDGAEHPHFLQQGDQECRNSALHLGLSEAVQVLHLTLELSKLLLLRPSGREGAPDLSVTDRPAPPTQRDPPAGLPLGHQIHGENSRVAVGRSRDRSEAPPGPRESLGPREQRGNSLFGPTAQASFAPRRSEPLISAPPKSR